MSTKGRKRGPKHHPPELVSIKGKDSSHSSKEEKEERIRPDPDQRPLGHAPKGSSDAFRKVWNQVKRECFWLKKSDTMVVTAYCNSWLEMERAHKYLMSLVGTPGQSINPRVMQGYQRMLDHAREACVTLMEQLGATPTSRRRVKEFGKKPDDGQGGRFLGGKRKPA